MQGSRPQRRLTGWLLAAMTALAPTGLMALETSLVAPGASKELKERIEETSSVTTPDSRGLDTPLEILSAALSDYRTIVQVLYVEALGVDGGAER